MSFLPASEENARKRCKKRKNADRKKTDFTRDTVRLIYREPDGNDPEAPRIND